MDNTTVRELMKFYAEQDEWTRAKIENHPPEEDAFWRHVEYIMAQFDGLYDGYKEVALPGWVTESSSSSYYHCRRRRCCCCAWCALHFE